MLWALIPLCTIISILYLIQYVPEGRDGIEKAAPSCEGADSGGYRLSALLCATEYVNV